MVRELKENEIKKFIDFGDSIYKDDADYVPYLRDDLKKTIKKLVFEKKRYKALCSFDENKKMNGRVLITVASNKQLNTQHCGYFSHFEIVNDQEVFNKLMDYMCQTLKEMGAEYTVGSFFHHDPDNRRGVLIDGFEFAPMLFTSHNPKYYQSLFENYGFEKLTDAYEYHYVEHQETIEKIKSTAEKSLKENDFHVDKLNLKNIDKDIEDAHKIMEIASTSINFENVLSIEEFKKLFKQMKRFVNPDYALVARKNSDNSPIGFALSIPDYYELIRKMKGRLDPRGLFIYLTNKNKITGLRAMLQYVVPEYQGKGISKALYYETKKSVDKNGVKRIALGTIMEKNLSSNGAITSLGGELSRIYRIYYKQI
ncbi:MAG: GNAT family N-acetyltransferase [Bacillota bacterium]|nr:GNAT family N-acetyltransferase [Bacillota bacterium]